MTGHGDGFGEVGGDVADAVFFGGGTGGFEFTPDQRHYFDVADELHGIEVLLAEGTGTGKNHFHHVFSRMR